MNSKWLRLMLISSFLLCFFNIKHYSQSESSLLWEISGKGLKKPSYLFGTIHVKDKRVFNLNDSVLIKFYECPILALELDFDSAMQEMTQLMIKQNMSRPADTVKTGNRGVFSKEQEALIRKKLALLTGTPEEQIQLDDPWKIFFVISQYAVRKGEMSEVLDLRLYRLAQKCKKK